MDNSKQFFYIYHLLLVINIFNSISIASPLQAAEEMHLYRTRLPVKLTPQSLNAEAGMKRALPPIGSYIYIMGHLDPDELEEHGLVVVSRSIPSSSSPSSSSSSSSSPASPAKRSLRKFNKMVENEAERIQQRKPTRPRYQIYGKPMVNLNKVTNDRRARHYLLAIEKDGTGYDVDNDVTVDDDDNDDVFEEEDDKDDDDYDKSRTSKQAETNDRASK